VPENSMLRWAQSFDALAQQKATRGARSFASVV
jgi:hypothetical protein